MARKKAGETSSAPSTSGTQPSELPLRAKVARRALLWGTVLALGVTAATMGYRKLHKHVETQYATSTVPPRIVLKNRPAWMRDDLADQITTAAKVGTAASAFDQSVLRDVQDQIMSDPDVFPWIEKINLIRREFGGAPGDTIHVDATFRAPIALVRSGDEFWMVDSQGRKLPKKCDADGVLRRIVSDDGKIVLRVVDGARNSPPDVGSLWKGADLQAGLELLRLLNDKPYAQDIVKVDVSNYAGRLDNAAAQLVLITRFNTQVRWGRPVSSTDYFVEVSPARKLAVLERLVADYGQVDAKRPWIDIRFDRVTYPRPTPAAPPTENAATAADTR